MGAGQLAFVIFNSLGTAVDKMDDWIYAGLKIIEIIGCEQIWEEDFKVFLCVYIEL